MVQKNIAKTIEINGIVQGVGFRPFVYRLAQKYHLSGDVGNTAFGVMIHVQGSPDRITSFMRDIEHAAPPLAHIIKMVDYPAPLRSGSDFSISPSRPDQSATTLISPDISICEDCTKELTDSKDRRFGYPFINCTNCGPRYTIIDNIPYDRANTTMKAFLMCPSCQAEYDDPTNRRFHAQPNACDVCGPHVMLCNNIGEAITTKVPVDMAAEMLKRGSILAIKGIGGYHLAVDATNENAVKRLRKRKKREEKPLAIMACDIDAAKRFAKISAKEETLLLSHRKPIVLVEKKEPNRIAHEVAPRNNYFGVMLPYTPLHCLILSRGFEALVMTSGNLSDEPIAIDNEEAVERLSGIADYFLMHNRDIKWGCDDSIVRSVLENMYPIRRSRGYVPEPVVLKKKVPPILACGGEIKNTICLTKGKNAFLSQHLGDLENVAAYDFYRATIQQLKHLLGIKPEIIACDMHPNYFSARYAAEQKERNKDITVITVQHHHAHIAGVMAENHLTGPVIGLAFDGTGWGPDHTIWGGEVLIVDEKGYTRMGHLETLPMPGAAAAIKEPWRMAVSYLYHTFGEDFITLDLPLFRRIAPENINLMVQMMKQKINSPLTSSLGRLFDGISAICGIREYSSFEGQAAMAVEMAASGDNAQVYDYKWALNSHYIIQISPVIRQVTGDLIKGVSVGVICQRFHNTLVHLFTRLCGQIRKDTGINQVALSGGVFQNVLLFKGMLAALHNMEFEVHAHTQVPANDGGISLGQAWIAAATDI